MWAGCSNRWPGRFSWRAGGWTAPGDEAVYLGERVVVLSASSRVVREQLKVGLPAERGQVHTRVSPRFAELSTHVYEQTQRRSGGRPLP
ncbi:ABC-type nitrate/sulfonate/bicarbonate transport system ATPase subunit [Streptomyces sp. DSM 40167]|nr:ABC-type nitrate/sulfonate/bicarbonate transport system ATPase subunit [Streptomyces sp. DSM 40167]